MKTGGHLWPEALWRDMIQRRVGGRLIRVFPDAEDSFYHMLAVTAGREGERTALVDNWGRAYTYARFLELTDTLAACLERDYGVQAGDHVGLLLYNGVEFCTAFLALSKLGAVTVPLPGKYKEPEVLSLAEKARLSHVICDDDFFHWFDAMAARGLRRVRCTGWERGYGFSHMRAEGQSTEARGTPEAPAIIMFTSGTTSRSKGVLLKNYNVCHAVVAYQRLLGITREDSSIIATPIYHITGMVALLGLFIRAGGTLYLHRKVEGGRMLACVRDNGVTFLHASPTVFHMLLDCREQFPELPSLRSMACGSSNMPAESIRRLKEWMPQADFHTVYGLTETSSPATVFPCGAADSPCLGSSGIPIPGLEVMIADENGNDLGCGPSGEILVRGTVVMESYYGMETDAITPEGWFRTGDIGRLNGEGFLWVEDRIKDMINRGGEKICSIDVENEIHALPGVAEAAVVGIPDEKFGEVAAAMIRPAPGTAPTEAAILAALEPRMARYKLPARILFTSALPVTANGKVDKRAIRAIFLSETAGLEAAGAR